MKFENQKEFTLAGATHVDKSDNKRKFGFTLAEVLITLGIIGVVSVLTIPNIISNYQKKVYVTQLQKGYAQLQQVFDMAMADDEVEYLADTELMNSIDGCTCSNAEKFMLIFGKYSKIQKACPPMSFGEGCHDVYYLDMNDSGNWIDEEDGYSEAGSNLGSHVQIFTKDGMIYYLHLSSSAYNWWTEEEWEQRKADGAVISRVHCNWNGLLLDVNGKKGPNKYGRDLFNFVLDEKGQVYPMGSAAFMGDTYAWNGSEPKNVSECHAASYGVGCAGRIIDQGWKMDY